MIDGNMSELELAPRSRGIVIGLRMLSGSLQNIQNATLTSSSSSTTSSPSTTSSTSSPPSLSLATSSSSTFLTDSLTASEKGVLGYGHVTSRACFPSMVDPTHSRNDLYVTLVDGIFAKDGKRTQKNVGVNVYALLNDGTPVQCIRRGTGKDGTVINVDHYGSAIFYHNGNPQYHETLCINLDVEGAKNIHLLFVFSHISSQKSKHAKIFGFAFMPLCHLQKGRRSQFHSLSGSDASILADGMHQLHTYTPVKGLDTLTTGGKGKGKYSKRKRAMHRVYGKHCS